MRDSKPRHDPPSGNAPAEARASVAAATDARAPLRDGAEAVERRTAGAESEQHVAGLDAPLAQAAPDLNASLAQPVPGADAPPTPTLRDALAAFHGSLVGKSPHTARTYATGLDHLQEYLATLGLDARVATAALPG